MTSNNRKITTQIAFTIELIRIDLSYNRTGIQITGRKEISRSPRFVLVKNSTNAHCLHLQGCLNQRTAQALQNSADTDNAQKSTNKMTDVHDKKTRSYNMSQIKAKNTRPEMMVRNTCLGKVTDTGYT